RRLRPEGTARRRQDRRAAGVGAGGRPAPGQRSRRPVAGIGPTLMATPGAPDIARRDGKLEVEQLAVADLARRFGTPLYVYSSAAMARALAPYQRALAGRDHLVCYAVKANSSLAVLQWFARQGCGFDI